MRLATITVLLALVTTVWAWWPEATKTEAEATSAGELFTTGGDEVAADKVSAVRVAIWDDKLKAAQAIKIVRKDGAWIIPSHYGYPSDAEKQVGSTTGAVLNVPRGQLVTSNVKDHAEYGVIDPLDPGAESSKETIGRRVTLWDESGAELVDVIIGKKVPKAQVHYVRRASESAVHTAAVQPQALKSSFEDWVQVDPLRISAGDIRTLAIQSYNIKEETVRGQLGLPTTRLSVKPEREVRLKKAKDDKEWKAQPPLPGEKLKQDVVGALTREAGSLKLTGIRPFSRAHLRARGIFEANPKTRAQLQNSGSLRVRDRQGEFTLLANKGELRIGTKDGLVYYLLFGEISADEDAEKLLEEGEKAASDRFMSVFVEYRNDFDETRPAPKFAKVDPPPAPKPSDAEGEVAAPTPPPAAPKIPTNLAAIEEAETAGRAKAREEQTRFTDFFYVISDESFKKLRPVASELFEEANASVPK